MKKKLKNQKRGSVISGGGTKQNGKSGHTKSPVTDVVPGELARYPWEAALPLPPGGVPRDELLAPMQATFLQGVSQHAWRVLGEYWNPKSRAFEELGAIQPEGCEAVARFLSKAFIKTLPEVVTDLDQFWEDFCIFSLRACHEFAEDNWFKAYLAHRIDRPALMPFLKRAVESFSAVEKPDLGSRLIFGVFWDLYILPLRFWSDEASSGLLEAAGQSFNLDRVRNTRRDLGLKRSQPIIVKQYATLPSRSPGVSAQIHVELVEKAAERLGVTGMLKAFIQYCKPHLVAGSKID